MKTIETNMPFCKSVSRWPTSWVLTFGIFLGARAWLMPTLLAQSTYEPYTFTTLAGPRNPGYGSADGTGSDARFHSPIGVAVDSAGNLYVAEFHNHTLRKVTPAGVVTTLAGLAGSFGSADGTGSDARFYGPWGVAVDRAGNVYVADSFNHTIRKGTPEGVVTTLAGLAGSAGSADGMGSAARFLSPRGVAVDSAGNVYVADSVNCAIRKVTPAGVVTTLAGRAGVLGSADGTGNAARFSIPSGVAVDSAGNVYVADLGNHTIRKVTPVGVVTTLAGLSQDTNGDGYPDGGRADGTGSAARFYHPGGIAVDSAGNVYVADSVNSAIRKVTPTGVVTTLAGNGLVGSADGTRGDARFWNPWGVAVDSAGNVYVADSENHTIRKVTLTGVVTTLAGLALGSSGGADGTGSAARFNHPGGIAVDSAGNVYVADTENHTIRKVTPAGVVTTLAGRAGVLGSANGTGSTARFNYPEGVAVDSAGNFYVADSGNSAIRKMTPAGVVTTLAGLAGNGGSADGTGSAARFYGPRGVAVDSAGNVYVADSGNHTIRKVTPAGVVTTLAGLAGNGGSADGTGNAARFYGPSDVALDSAGNVYVVDYQNNTIRKVTPTGVVTTLAGLVLGGSTSGVAVDSAGNVYVVDNSRIRKVSPAGVVTLLAGLALSSGSADGTGTDAHFNQPQGVAVDSAGNVYVADTHNQTIRKGYATPGIHYALYTFTTLAGNGGDGSADGTGSAARFNHPSGVAVDSAGNVYVADSSNNTIRKVTPTGVVTTLAGLAGEWGSADGTGSAARFNHPRGVAVDSAGNVYVADTLNYTIRKVTPAGVVTTLAGLAGSSGYVDGTGSDARFSEGWIVHNGAIGVAVDSAGNVYVADSGNGAIRQVTLAGVVTTLAEGFWNASGVAVDSAGNVYVADTLNHTIRKVTPAGVVTTLAGRGGGDFGSEDGTGSAAQFSSPQGLAVDSAGNVYVADTYNFTIRKVSPTGVVTTLAGLAGGPGNADGTGSAARFGYSRSLDGDFGPSGVALDSAGNVYVADTANHTIRKGYPENVPAVIVTSAPGFGFNGGQFGFNLTGPAGRSVVVEASTDLVNWLPLWTNTFAGALNFGDPQSGVSSHRFYRAHMP